jgi:hypothetical protein
VTVWNWTRKGGVSSDSRYVSDLELRVLALGRNLRIEGEICIQDEVNELYLPRWGDCERVRFRVTEKIRVLVLICKV